MNGKKLSKYLVITFLITWLCWWGDALLVKETALSDSDVVPMLLFTLGGFGPTIAACLCLDGGFHRDTLKRFLFRNTKKNRLTILAAVIVETAVFFVCSDGLIESIPRSPVAILVVIIVFLQAAVLYGGNEELGWRGTMLPVLEQVLPAPAAALIVGLVWVCWHIPLWFIEGNSHQSMSFIGFAALGLALSYWLSAVYDLTGAVVYCMILHGWTNTLMGLVAVRQSPLYTALLLGLTAAAMGVSIGVQRRKKGMQP